MKLLMKLGLITALGLTLSTAQASTLALDSGQIQGKVTGDVHRFLGVPYATPPVGALRWRAPRKVSPWPGLRPALQAASACTQVGSIYATDDETRFNQAYGSEDCLYLNIWIPDAPARNKPVLIYLHGGSAIVGDPAHPIYDASRLARETGAVIISANYRLGVWGSLQTPALHTGDAAEDSGNYFLLDLIQVLDWTARNCVALGCNADNITISGQSAGAVAVLALMRSPLAAGKFHKAISISGLPFSGSADAAQERTRKLLRALLINDGKAENEPQADTLIEQMTSAELRDYLRSRPNDALLSASGFGLVPTWYGDGTVLIADDEDDRFTDKLVNKVPLMMGRTGNEMSTLVPIKGIGRDMIKLWPLVNGEPREETVREQIGLIAGMNRHIKVGFFNWYVNRAFRKIQPSYAEQLPALYAYRFDWDNYPRPWVDDFGAMHSLDVPFIFGNFIDNRKAYMRFAWTEDNIEEREALHGEMADAIRRFVHESPEGGAIPWQAWDKKHKYTQIWDR